MSLITKISYHFDGSDVIIWYSFETNYSIYVTAGNCNTFSRFIKLKEELCYLFTTYVFHFEFFIILDLIFLNENFLNHFMFNRSGSIFPIYCFFFLKRVWKKNL